jgi:hypothetical protein
MALNNATTTDFEDIKVNIKIKLSALWTSVTLCYFYCDYFELYVPKKVEGLISGVNLLSSPMKLFGAAILMSIPALMVFLSLVLKPRISKGLNIVFGAFFTAIMVLIAFSYQDAWYNFYLFYAIVESILTSLIVWYAWTWPKQKNI